MKKFLSLVLSAVMAASVCAVAVVPAMAETVNSQQSTTKKTTVSVEVNGNTSNDVTYKTDTTDPSKIKFEYTGSGDLTGWEFEGLTEGVDYIVVTEDGKTITIQLLNGVTVDQIDIKANALVENVKKPTKKPSKNDNGGKSPNTGAAVMTGVAVAGAGFAVLTALKKRD